MESNTAQVETAAQRVAAFMAANGLTVESEFVPFSKSRNAGKKELSLNWRVTLKHNGRDVLATDYSAGVGHCPAYKRAKGRMVYGVRETVAYECENGRRGYFSEGFHSVMSASDRSPIKPEAADVLYSLATDSDAIDYATFESWAENCGYDTDSRKGEAIYRACLEIGLKLRAGLGESLLAAARVALQDY